MADDNNDIPDPNSSGIQQQKQRLKLSSLLLLLLSILLLAGSLSLGILVFQQIRTLEANVQITENIINANVRTLGQAQRELLRMIALLESGETDPGPLEMQRAFVAQRMQEATLSYQLQTLGTTELMAQSRDLSARWDEEVEPLIRQIMADPADDDGALRAAAVAHITELELGFNELVAQGEINRKRQAGSVNDATIDILNSERMLLIGLGITMLIFFGFMGVTAVLYYRFDRQREFTARELVKLNAELRQLSQVASRTDNLVIIMDARGQVEWVNEAFEQTTGYTLAEVTGRQPFQLLQGPETDQATLAEIKHRIERGEGCRRCEAFAYAKDQQKFWVGLELQTVEDQHGRLVNFVAIMTNLTLQREREMTIAQNSQLLDVINRAQNEFLLTNTPGMMFDQLLDNLLAMTKSEYGFIGEVLHTAEGQPYLKTHAITNIAWSDETRKLYEQQAVDGMEFYNLKTLFGAALTSQEPVIANNPATDARRGGMPAGHPAMNAFLGVPFFNARQEMVGLVGIANRPGGYDQELVEFLRPFLATCGNLIEAYRNEQRRQAAEAELVKLNAVLARRSEEVTEQRDFALQIMNNMGQGLTVVDENGHFTFVNPAFANMVNEKPEDLIGRSPEEFTLPADQDALTTAGARRRQGEITTYETRIRRADGQVLDALITGVPRYRHSTFAGSIAVITDLTTQKQVEAALRKSETEARKLSQVASRTDNMVIISDAAGNVEWVNDAFTRVTGYTLAEVVGQRPGHLLQGAGTDPAVVAMMRQHIHNGQGFNTEVLNYAKNGRPYWVEIEVQPVHDDQGTLTNFIAIETDITERRQADQDLRRAKEAAEQAAQAKAAFLASMSHEIRTPLNAVIGLNSLLLTTDLTPKQRQFAETARNSGNLLLMLINNVLDFSALESGRVELEQRPFQLHRGLQEIVDLLQHEANRKKLSLAYKIDPSISPVLIGDETRLRQVLLNLIGNSIKFTETGGIQVDVAPLAQEGKPLLLHFSVQDTGIGIPEDRLDRLFQPFTQIDASTTRKYGGSGLGLAISKMIVNLMGGEITVDSRVGQGTTFQFTVQLRAGDPASLPTPANNLPLDQRLGQRWPLRILLVEDDSVNQKVALHMLEQLGYRADIAANGWEALSALRRQPYDVVFMDIHMPEMDGVTATQQIHAEWPPEAIPVVVAMTASALEGDRERFMAAGMDDYISKPIQLETIAATLAGIARGQSDRSEGDGDGWTELPPGRSTSPTAASPVDTVEFRDRMGAGQDSLLHQLVTLFIAEANRSMPELRQAISSAQAKRVRELAHLLKGSGASSSAVQFAALAHTLEQQARQGDLTGAEELFEQMSAELARVNHWRQAND